MSNDTAHPEPPAEPVADEQLVAYLDGELDDEASRRVEAILAADPDLRQQLAQLDRTWEALDGLGRVEVDERFTQTTMEMVALAAEEDVEKQQAKRPRKTRQRWLQGGVVLTAAAVAGFLTVILTRDDPNRELLDDLPVLEHLEQYRQVEDVKFLRQLEELFPEPTDEE